MQRPSPPNTPSRSPVSDRATLLCLGPGEVVRVADNNESELLLGPGKPLAVLVFLLLSPGRSASRERLVDLLWSDSEPSAGRKQLRNALSHLRSRIGSWVVDDGERTCTLATTIDADVFEFRTAVDSRCLARAVELYKADFLTGFASPGATEFELWAEGERTHFRSLAGTAAEMCCREALDSGKFGEARRLAERFRGIDPESDLGWRLSLEALARSGDAVAAAAEAGRFESWLRLEEREPEPASRVAIRTAREVATSASDAPGKGGPLIADLVGREREFNSILDAWARARAGGPQLVLLSGSAGLGKTRLLEDLRRRFRFRRHRVVFVRGYPGDRMVPFSFLVSLVRALTQIPGAAGVPAAVVPTLLAIDPRLSDVYSGTAEAGASFDALSRRAVALQELLAAVSDEQPLALFVDDFHWIDEASRSVLTAALSHTAASYLLVTIASRSVLAGFGGESRRSSIELSPLSAQDVENLIASIGVLPREARWPHLVVARVAEASGGVPLLVFATLDQLINEGILSVRDAEWHFAPTTDAEDLLRRVNPLESRIAALPAEQRRVILACAVAGVPLPRRLLRRASGSDPAIAETSVLELERVGHLYESGGGIELTHDAIGEAALAQSDDALHRAVERDLGLTFVNEADGRWIERGIRHLLGADDSESAYAALSRLARTRARRATGSSRDLVANILALPLDDPRVDRGVRALPLGVKLMTHRRVLLAVALVLTTGIAVSAIAHANAAPPPDALLEILIRGDRLHARSALIPIRGESWPTTRALSANFSGWRVDTLPRVGTGAQVFPGKDAWAIVWQAPDSGGVDVALAGPGGITDRLTKSRADETPSSWSPDGRQLLVETSQFGDSGHKVTAIMDVRTRNLRPLTQDHRMQLGAWWSPDGSRIAIGRTLDGGNLAVCTYTVDARLLRCVTVDSTPMVVLGWVDYGHLFITVGEKQQLTELDIETGSQRPAGAPRDGSFNLSPDGQWIVSVRDAAANRIEDIEVMSTKDLSHPRQVTSSGVPGGQIVVAWRGSVTPREYLDSVSIESGIDSIQLGSSFVLRASGRSNSGRAIPLYALQWRSLDTSVATVDSTGVVRGRRAGTVIIEASAGGWRRTRKSFRLVNADTSALFAEDWTRPMELRWERFGTPFPLIVRDSLLGPSFWNNGNGTYFSGAYLRTPALDARDGLALDAVLRMHITRQQWQYFNLGFVQILDMLQLRKSWNHTSGYMPAQFLSSNGCLLSYPDGEGPTGAQRLNPGRVELRRQPGASLPPLALGVPTHVRVQIMPDGRCGIAIDGIPVFLGAPLAELDSLHVLTEGSSVDTRILIGPLKVRRGVPADIDWGRLSMPARPRPDSLRRKD
jgi:DNA-binding SARP family transcriptional activator